ncbi:lanC-like protein 2 isoform X2 [Tubulanus polymorphus]
MEHGLKAEEVDNDDFSVYTGMSGIALLYYHLHRKLDDENGQYLKSAESYLKRPLRHLKGKRVSFLCGDAGPLALGAVIYNEIGRKDDSFNCLQQLISLHDSVCKGSPPDELLFGRVGYLYALLFVRLHLGDGAVDQSIVEKVFNRIIESGRRLSHAENSQAPLMYEWHDSKYLGAAHGISGIMYILMQCNDEKFLSQLDRFVRPTVDWLSTLQFPSGNFPSSIGSRSGDKLVHWCHGAPGWAFMFAMAYKTFKDDTYLSKLKQCGEVVWKRGLLKKGYGICHGTGGNAYTFLILYKLTGDVNWLYRAIQFAEWCLDYGKHDCRTPDRPYSLFEGLAGTIYFLADILSPNNARFPAFQLS